MNRSRAADRHRRLARRRRQRELPAPGPRRMSANGTLRSVSRLQVGDAAAGHAEGHDRRGQPLVLKQIGVNLLTRDTDQRLPVRHRPGQAGIICRSGPRRSITAASRRSFAPGRLRHIVGAAASCSASTSLLGRSTWLQTDGLVTHARRAEPDRAFGRNRQLPRRRRVPDPGLAVARRGDDRVQAIWRRPRLHADRPRRRPHLDARPPGSQRAVSDAGSVKLNGFIVPALTTRRAETTVELGSGQIFMIAGLLQNTQQQQHRQGAVPWRPADPRRAVPLDQLPAPGDRAGDHRHAVSGAPGLRPARAADRRLSRADRRRARLRGQSYKGVSGPAAVRGPAAAPGIGRLAPPPLRGSSCDPPLLQEGCDDAFETRSCIARCGSRLAALQHRHADLPDRGVAAVNVPVVTTRRLCVRRRGARRRARAGRGRAARRLVPAASASATATPSMSTALMRGAPAPRSRRSPAATACWLQPAPR